MPTKYRRSNSVDIDQMPPNVVSDKIQIEYILMPHSVLSDLCLHCCSDLSVLILRVIMVTSANTNIPYKFSLKCSLTKKQVHDCSIKLYTQSSHLIHLMISIVIMMDAVIKKFNEKLSLVIILVD